MRRFVLAASLLAGLAGGFVPPADGGSTEAPELEQTQMHDVGCEQPCPGDDAEGNCPPGCDDCGCCPGMAPGEAAVARPLVRAAPATVVPLLPAPAAAPTGLSPDVWRPPRRS